MIKKHWLLSAACLSGALLLGGCASTPTTAESYKASGFIDQAIYAKLEPDSDGSGALIYRKPGFNLKHYNKVMLDSIKVWYKDNSEYKGIDPEQLRTLTGYFQRSLIKALEPAYPIVNKPGADVLRIRTAITEITPTNPGMSVVALLLPFGTVADVAAGRGTGGTFYLGDTAIEAEFRDSVSDELLAAYVEKRFGKKYDLDTSEGTESAVNKTVDSYARAYTTWGYAEQAFDYWAWKLRRRLDAAHGVPTPTPARVETLPAREF
ncbi:MAG: DUF3313 domain-containing protein [Candidatus Competibacter denitrificans]